MPLKSGAKNVGWNINELLAAGHKLKQARAIALKKAGKYTKGKKP